MGRHRATPGTVMEPMQAVRADTPPIDPRLDTAAMPAVTDWDEWDPKRETDPDRHMEPLRHGGARVEARMRQTFRDRGLILAKRVGRRALRLRAALAKGSRR